MTKRKIMVEAGRYLFFLVFLISLAAVVYYIWQLQFPFPEDQMILTPKQVRTVS